MIEHPFLKRRSAQELGPNNRRSTRVEFASPVVVSGRDAKGEVFHEETETSVVNLHGCKLKLSHQVLVGMVVGLETPYTRSPAKAICVHVWDPPRGETLGEIAVQLLRPQNIWGVANPPPDWEKVLESLSRGLAGISVTAPGPAGLPAQAPPAPAQASKPATPGPVPIPAPSRVAPPRAAASPVPAQASKPTTPGPVPVPAPSRVAPPRAASPPVPTQVSKPAAEGAVPVRASAGAAAPRVLNRSPLPAPVAPRATPAASGAEDSHLAELEDRSWQLMDSVLQVLRDQTEELVRGTLEEFREQIEVLVRDAESRLKERADESFADVESSINALRRDLAEQLDGRTEEIVESARQALHARVEEMFSSMFRSPQNKPPSK